jgi:pimeloyl-ACP methyl ester carboxylesterase
MMVIRRRFFDLDGRQLHYRCVQGDGVPIVLLHMLPGSARQLARLMTGLEGHTMYAPDMAGLGDSDVHPAAEPKIADYAADVLSLIDGLSLREVDLYGTHTGSCIALELAHLAAPRVRRIVLDGAALFEPEEAARYAADYPPRFAADINGAHLLYAHNFCRDLFLFWPWYERTAAASRRAGLPPAADLHVFVMEVLKGMDGYSAAYQAAFGYDMAQALARISHPTLCIAGEDDVLAEHSKRAALLLARGELSLIKDAGSTAGIVAAFVRGA